jgi:hypothetical protein
MLKVRFRKIAPEQQQRAATFLSITITLRGYTLSLYLHILQDLFLSAHGILPQLRELGFVTQN